MKVGRSVQCQGLDLLFIIPGDIIKTEEKPICALQNKALKGTAMHS